MILLVSRSNLVIMCEVECWILIAGNTVKITMMVSLFDTRIL
jgi:hypothetical protein